MLNTQCGHSRGREAVGRTRWQPLTKQCLPLTTNATSRYLSNKIRIRGCSLVVYTLIEQIFTEHLLGTWEAQLWTQDPASKQGPCPQETYTVKSKHRKQPYAAQVTDLHTSQYYANVEKNETELNKYAESCVGSVTQ